MQYIVQTQDITFPCTWCLSYASNLPDQAFPQFCTYKRQSKTSVWLFVLPYGICYLLSTLGCFPDSVLNWFQSQVMTHSSAGIKGTMAKSLLNIEDANWHPILRTENVFIAQTANVKFLLHACCPWSTCPRIILLQIIPYSSNPVNTGRNKNKCIQ